MQKSRMCNIYYQIIKISGKERYSTCINVNPMLISTHIPFPSISLMQTVPCFMHVCISIASHLINVGSTKFYFCECHTSLLHGAI